MECEKFYVGDKLSPITKVVVHIMDGNKFTSGTDGRTLNVDCPWGSQAVADIILSVVSGYRYTPFTAEQAIIDPSLELGDILEDGNLRERIYQNNAVYCSALLATLGAMEEKEIDHEYPYRSAAERSTARGFGGVGKRLDKQDELFKSFGVELGQTASKLDTYVKDTDDLKKAKASLYATVYNPDGSDRLTARVDFDTLSKTVTDIDGNVGKLETANATIQATLYNDDGSEKVASKVELNAVNDTLNGIQQAQAGISARVDGAEASLKLEAENIKGVASSVATLEADVINLKGRVNLTDVAYVNPAQGDQTGGLGVKGALSVSGGMTSGGEIYLTNSKAGIWITSMHFTPVEITSYNASTGYKKETVLGNE